MLGTPNAVWGCMVGQGTSARRLICVVGHPGREGSQVLRPPGLEELWECAKAKAGVAWKMETEAALRWSSWREELPTREVLLRFFSNADGPGHYQETRGRVQTSV